MQPSRTSETGAVDPILRQIEALPKVRQFPVVGTYILCARLGAGGAGAVYMGYHVKLQRPVAVKILNPALIGHSSKAIARFEREAILSSQFRSDYIIPVTDAGSIHGTDIHYLVMDLVDGENAEERVERYGNQGLDLAAALLVMQGASRGLIEAHQQGVIHRDLKPANIMISTEGQVRIADLGIATSLERPNLIYTQAEEFVGTPQYMSPEQIHGQELDGRTDVYSLGVTLYHLLTGLHPFEGPTAYAVMKRVSSEALPDVRELRSDVPKEVAALIEAATQRDPDNRIPSAEALASRVDAMLQHQPEVSLADSNAGADRRSLHVAIASEELQSIAAEVATLAPANAVGPKRRWTLLGSLLLLAGLAASLVIGLGDRPIDVRIIAAQRVADVELVAELLPEALTTSTLSESARDALVRTTSDWLTGRLGGVTELGREENQVLLKLLTMLEPERESGVVNWLVEQTQRLTEQQAWTALSATLDVLEQADLLSPGLGVRIGGVAVNDAKDIFVREGPAAISDEALEVLRRLEPFGPQQIPTFLAFLERLASDVATISAARKCIRDASELDLLEAVRDTVLSSAVGHLAAERDAREAIKYLNELAETFPGSRERIAGISASDARQAIGALRWGRVAEHLHFVRGVNERDFSELAGEALDAMPKVVQRDALGTTRISGVGSERLLELLVESGVPGASRWLVELRVAWTEEDDVVFAAGVTPSERDRFVDLLNAARAESRGWAKGRMLFIKADVHFQTLLEVRDTGLLEMLDAGLALGNSDAASRWLYLHWDRQHVLDQFKAELRQLGHALPTWKALDECLRQALQSGDERVSRSRALLWHGYGMLVFDPDADRRNESLRVRAVEQMLEAYEAGNRMARDVLLGLAGYWPEVVGGELMTPQQRERLD